MAKHRFRGMLYEKTTASSDNLKDPLVSDVFFDSFLHDIILKKKISNIVDVNKFGFINRYKFLFDLYFKFR